MDMTTDEGQYAYENIQKATPWDEAFYDYTPQQLNELIAANTKSAFVYIKYTYKQLGRGDEYLQQMIKDLEENYEAVRREVLLEWAQSSSNCPFEKADLDKIQNHLKDSNKVQTIMLCGYYKMYLYERMSDSYYPPIIGVA